MTDLQNVVLDLHSKVCVVIETERTPRGRIKWEKTVTGENFLDGPWEHKVSGISRSIKKAVKDAMKA